MSIVLIEFKGEKFLTYYKVSSLHPSNDYKTVGPQFPLCCRAVDYSKVGTIWVESLPHPRDLWQSNVILAIPNSTREVCSLGYECNATERIIVLCSSFQQAVLKNLNERNAQLQKQLDNVIREG